MFIAVQQKLAIALDLFQRGKIEEADLVAKDLLMQSPKSADALHLRGVIAGLQHRHSDAESFLLAAVSLDKKNHFIHFNLAKALSEQDKDKESLSWHRKALELDPRSDKTWLNYGLSLRKLGELKGAVAAFDRALAINISLAEGYTNKGSCLREMGALDEALALHNQAVELSPSLAEAWHNRGVALGNLRRHEEALVSYDQAIELKPDYAEAWSNRGVTLKDLRRHEEALASYERAIELKPDSPDALHNKGLLQLAQKDFVGGFENYLLRWDSKNFTSPTLKTGLPLCNPTIEGRNLLLWAEQGIGDEIFYAGMLNQALEKFPNISLVADARLHPLFSRSFPMVTLLVKDQPLTPEFLNKTDLQAPIGDLGHILGLNSDAIMSTRRPFLVADRAKSSKFESLAPFSSGKITCGLAWRSHNKNFGEEKSIDLEKLEPILKNAHLEFINLQYGEVDSEIQEVRNRFGVNVHQVEGVDVYNDIDGLLALIDACDIVVTTSNVTAHLAGSIGKRGCVFVPSSKGKIWYWHLDDANSFWYPSLKLCYQDDRYDWTDTIVQAIKWIERDVSWR